MTEPRIPVSTIIDKGLCFLAAGVMYSWIMRWVTGHWALTGETVCDISFGWFCGAFAMRKLAIKAGGKKDLDTHL